MKRRISSFILAALIMISIIPLAVFANGSETEYLDAMTLTVDTVTVGNDDESVSVSIKVERNSGFAGVQYQLVYNKDVFSLESDPVVGDIDGMTLVASGPLDGGKHMCMLSTSNGANTTVDGTLVTYTFNIDENAPAGTYGFSLITDGTADLPDGGTVPLEILDENQQKVASVVLNGSVTIPGYKISYDANGGMGAPEGTTKSKNIDVAVSKTIPERDGFNFLGWSTNPVSTQPQYKGGDMYSDNADVVFYAVWEAKPETVGTVKMEVETVEGRTGAEVQVKVNITDNPEIHSMVFDVTYDENVLEYVSVEKGLYGNICVEHASKLNYQYMDLYNFGNTMTENGTLLTFTFRIKQEAAEGLTEINIVPDYDTFIKLVGQEAEEGLLDVDVTSGGVVVSAEIAGDINHDEKVNADDAVLLLNHLTHDEAIAYKGSLDFSGDGKVDKDDVAALLRFVLFPDDFSIEEASLAQETEAVYTFESKLGYIGEEIEVVISLEAYEAFKAAGIANISYDEDVFTLNGCDLTNEFGALSSFENFSDKTIVALDETDIASYNGTFAVLRFTINENAEPGTYTITGIPGLAKSDRLECSVNAGTITVKDVSEKPVVPVEKVDIDVSTVYLPVGETTQLDVTVTPEEATNKSVTWTSSNEEVATVDEKGVVTALTNGTAKITATSDNGKQDTCTVYAIIPADAIDLSAIKITSVAPEKYITLKAKAVCLDGSKPYKTDVFYEIIEGRHLATINEAGKLTAGEQEGDVVVRATAVYGTETAYSDIAIKICLNLASKVTLNKTKAGIALGYGDLKLDAVMTSKTGECTDTLTWSVDKPEIATVDQNGLVTAHAVGKAKITATSGSGKKATCTVTVGEVPTTKVDVSGIKATSVAPGKSITLKAKAGRDDKTKPVSTAVDYEIIEGGNLATIDAKGKFVAGEREGDVVVGIKAEAGTEDAYETVTIRICSGLATKVTLSKTKAAMALGYGDLELEAVMACKEEVCEDTLTWSVDKPEIATVDQNGVVTAHDVGKVKVTAMSGSGKKATCTVTVGLAADTVELSSLKATSLAVGKTLSLKAKASREDGEKPVSTAVVFEILDGEEFAELDAKGKIKALAEGTLTVRARAEAGTYDAYADVEIRVCVPATRVTLNMTKATIEEAGEELQLEAVMTPEDHSDILIWSSSNENVATVDENGLVTAHATGIVKITATSGSGKSAACTVTIGVPATKVKLNMTRATMMVGGSLWLEAEMLPYESTDTITWSVDKEWVATVDEYGLVRAHSEGTVKVTATSGSGKKTTCTINVDGYLLPFMQCDVQVSQFDADSLMLDICVLSPSDVKALILIGAADYHDLSNEELRDWCDYEALQLKNDDDFIIDEDVKVPYEVQYLIDNNEEYTYFLVGLDKNYNVVGFCPILNY